MSAHDFHICSTSDVLLLSFDEDWAVDGYKNRFGESLLEHAKEFNDKKWAVIDDISNWPIKIPEEMEMCNELATRFVEKGFRHCAVCGQEYAISKWMMNKVIPNKVEIAYFDSLSEAKNWLSSLGYNTNFQ
ncbi:hypothetical protein Q4489_11735 [Thalassotalea sp. 1_MG-2023]|uniref:hypothetical protein n=1 Tax=Thalassotalea sp. 1_MG-2023 TaxID=3062680 RepID=UPI0026E1EDA1|nr:hypothetical protein [Thalassotalea sp. 1_MG-2023]MDO6427693.1 hypothetical protein [Thalassotalea sp. 1_MG-2023]